MTHTRLDFTLDRLGLHTYTSGARARVVCARRGRSVHAYVCIMRVQEDVFAHMRRGGGREGEVEVVDMTHGARNTAPNTGLT